MENKMDKELIIQRGKQKKVCGKMGNYYINNLIFIFLLI